MKKLLLLALLLPTIAEAQWIKGFNLRSSSGYCTDPTNTTYILKADNYPVTRNSVTFGRTNTGSWWSDPDRDRDSGVDCRLAGEHQNEGSSGQINEYTVDLTATGDYDFRCAIGSATQAGKSIIKVYDNTTLLATIGGGAITTSGGQFADANGTVHTSAANWVSNNTALSLTFSTTTAKITVEYGATGGGANAGRLAHFQFEQATASTNYAAVLNAMGEL